MDGYGDATYGDGFADVYDDWYGDVSDVAATVEGVLGLAAAAGGPVLELGIGTGRLAIPLAARGVEVHGVDASGEMVRRLRAKPGADGIPVTVGPMDGDQPAGPFGVVFVAFNTFLNLATPAAQEACMRSVASRLRPGGVFAVETFVPGEAPDPDPAGTLEVRSIEADRVVLIASQRDADGRTVSGQHVEITEAGVRLRPWRIRVTTPAELDAMAAAAGLRLERAAADWSGTALTDDSPVRVAVYRLPP